MSKYKLINAAQTVDGEEYLIESESQEYKIYFDKHLSTSSVITLRGTENREEVKEIFAILDNLRGKELTLAEIAKESSS